MRIRWFTFAAALLLALASSGCTWTKYEKVEDGAKGPTSPKESGIQGATADGRAPFGSAQRAAQEHQIVPYTEAFTNGFTDPTMEGSGNVAGQGNYHPGAVKE